MDLKALRAAVVSARERAAEDESRLPDLGWAIYSYCLELRNHQSPVTVAYLEILEEGIGVLRRLQRRDQGFIGALGLMLGWQGYALHQLGRAEQSRESLVEGTALLRQGARQRVGTQHYELYETQLALALGLSAYALNDAGEHQAALSAAREALGIWRTRASEQPGQHDRSVVRALDTVGYLLSLRRRFEEAWGPAEEAVAVARRIYAAEPGGDNARLVANALDRLAELHANSGQWPEALPLLEESIGFYRVAGRRGTFKYSLTHASALNNAAKAYLELGQRDRAQARVQSAAMRCALCARRTADVASLQTVAQDIINVLGEVGLHNLARTLAKGVNRRLSGKASAWSSLLGAFRRG
jgi:tetratricopeptide (TPR) repeat protein